MTFENLLLERDEAVAIVTFNRPKVLNALNAQTLTELAGVLDALKADAGIRAVVLTGAGDKSFVAGADINELAVQTPVQGKEHARRGQQVFDAIEQLGKPVIAAVNGFALGGGCELAMACTLRLAADTARFGQPEINLGIIPGYAGTQRLPRLVGKGVALEILLTGDMISAQRAYDIGLVNKVVPAADLMTEAKRLAHALASKAPIAARYIIEAVNQGLDAPFTVAEYLETALFGTIAASDDMKEGTRAFLEKRTAVWHGQ
ncbi:MAG TPA: enoyl-CoA hydratase-related protein [Vicinamibacterales bacterium]|nr:enoyl-CoA hydratase-related protein [Vicinamibacterales bacterium]